MPLCGLKVRGIIIPYKTIIRMVSENHERIIGMYR